MKKRFLIITLLVIAAATALVGGCSTGDNKGDTTAQLYVLSTTPTDSGTAARDTLVVVVFNQGIKESTVTDTNFYVTDSAGNRITGQLEYFSANNRIIFTSESYYTNGETYTVYVKGDIESSDDVKLDNDYIFNFSITD